MTSDELGTWIADVMDELDSLRAFREAIVRAYEAPDEHELAACGNSVEDIKIILDTYYHTERRQLIEERRKVKHEIL